MSDLDFPSTQAKATTVSRNFLRGLVVDRVDLVPAGANPAAHIALFKSDSTSTIPQEQRDLASSNPIQEEVPMTDTPGSAAVEETVAKADHDAVVAKMAELEKQLADAETAKTEADELRKQLTTTQEDVAKMRQEAREREFIAKADEYKVLGNVDEIGKLLMAADEHFTAEQGQFLHRLLSGASAQVEKGDLFSQFAKTNTDGPGSWEEQLVTKAQALVDAGTCQTIEIAKQQVMRTDPDIRREYTASTRGER